MSEDNELFTGVSAAQYQLLIPYSNTRLEWINSYRKRIRSVVVCYYLFAQINQFNL